VIALGAKKQAKKTATLNHRTEAIEHVRRAIADLANNAVVTPETLKRIRDARDLSELVFSRRITEALDLVCRVISNPMADLSDLGVPPPPRWIERLLPEPREANREGPYHEGHNLDEHLRAVLAHMAKEAKLGS
jgi:hypothetical protein